MNPTDLPCIDKQLRILSALYRSRELDRVAVRAWGKHLKAFDVGLVCDVLEEWPRAQAHFPTIDLVRKLCTERLGRLEWAKRERSVSLGPTQHTAASRKFFSWFAEFKKSSKSPRVAGFVRVGDALHVPDRNSQSESEVQREARLEREAIL